MKKKIIVSIIICLITILGIIGYIFWNNRMVSTITLDINPSIEISLDRNNKIKSVIALNESANLVISDDYKGLSIGALFYVLIDKLIDNNFVEDNNVSVILHTTGTIDSKELSETIELEFGKKEIHTDIIIVDKVTNEDIKLAKEYNVSPAKIAYIKTITGESENIDLNMLANKSVGEIEKTKKTGKYCDEEYFLENDWCLKEKERISATNGEYCPSGYKEDKGKCYEVIDAIETGKYICNEGFVLIDNTCVHEESYDALGICEKGEYKDGYCLTKEYYGDAKEYCRITPSTDLLYNGRCLGRKPTINGKCLGSDKLIGGYCYDTSPSSGYKADWVCPDGKFITNPDGSLMYEDKKCYNESKVNPTSYYCEGEGILDGKKCKTKTIENPQKEKKCTSGYISIEDGSRCINLNKTKSKENGLVCNQDNARLKDNTCVIYDIKPAKNY